MKAPVRIGILGAATVAPAALIAPARLHPEVEVAAVAARDRTRAEEFAARHGIPAVHDTYESLVSDPSLDAVYNPLPNGLHGQWTVAALRSGKHVLCEKPFAANAAEAVEVAAAARDTGLVAMEAFHYRYHPYVARALEVIASGRLGRVRRIETWFRARLRPRADIRWDLALAGGAMMDIGCYPVHLLRTLAGTEPGVRSATAGVRRPDVDRWMRAEMTFPDGRTGFVSASMLSRRTTGSGARVIGSQGRLELSGFVSPHVAGSILLHTDHGRRRQRFARLPTTFGAQLDAFADAVLRGVPPTTGVDDAVANMRVIDACYTAAGLPLRQPS